MTTAVRPKMKAHHLEKVRRQEHVTEARRHRTAESLPRQRLSCPFGFPSQQRSDQSEVAKDVEEEREGRTGCGHDYAANRRPDAAHEIVAHAVERNPAWQVFARQDISHGGLPRGIVQCPTTAD